MLTFFRRKAWTLVSAVIVMALGLGGCGDVGDNGDNGDNGDDMVGSAVTQYTQ
jgi:hypothetical protein